MGKILSSKRRDNYILFEVELDINEATHLQGHYDNVHLFTEKIAEFQTGISSRGKNSMTKYFLIPRKLRKKLDFNCLVQCQKIESKDKTIFIYVVNNKSRNSIKISTK